MSKNSLEFHIKSNDYFGTLATILSLWQQQDTWPENYKELIDDLMYLQNNYKIIKKNGSKSSSKEY